jgi:hypothetical protein
MHLHLHLILYYETPNWQSRWYVCRVADPKFGLAGQAVGLDWGSVACRANAHWKFITWSLAENTSQIAWWRAVRW